MTSTKQALIETQPNFLTSFNWLWSFYFPDYEFESMVIAMVGRFFVTYAMNAGAQISLEVCPTELRGQGSGLANVFAQASVFFAPQIVYSVKL